jgi:hypothetical protein
MLERMISRAETFEKCRPEADVESEQKRASAQMDHSRSRYEYQTIRSDLPKLFLI